MLHHKDYAATTERIAMSICMQCCCLNECKIEDKALKLHRTTILIKYSDRMIHKINNCKLDLKGPDP